MLTQSAKNVFFLEKRHTHLHIRVCLKFFCVFRLLRFRLLKVLLLENGQRVYFTFTTQNAPQRAAEPPTTSLTAFFLYVSLIDSLKHYYIRKFRSSTRGINLQKPFKGENKEKESRTIKMCSNQML